MNRRNSLFNGVMGSAKVLICQDAIFRVVAAVLHLGNIEFSKGKEIDSSEPKDDKSQFHLKMTAKLFMYVIIFPFLLYRNNPHHEY